MPVKLTHPLHGAHYATGSEVEDMRKNGWTEAPPKVKEEPAPDAPAENLEDLAKTPPAAKEEKQPAVRKAPKQPKDTPAAKDAPGVTTTASGVPVRRVRAPQG